MCIFQLRLLNPWCIQLGYPQRKLKLKGNHSGVYLDRSVKEFNSCVVNGEDALMEKTVVQ